MTGFYLSSYLPLIEHWDGTAWTVVPLVPPEVLLNVDATLRAITFLSAYNVWAVGGGGLILHFTARGWTAEASNIPLPANGFTLSGVAARSSADGWTVGSAAGGRTVTAHFVGTQWTAVPGPNPGTVSNALYGVARLRGGPTVAVGSRDDGHGPAPLIARAA